MGNDESEQSKMNVTTQEVKGIFHFYEFPAPLMSLVSLAEAAVA